MTRSQLEHAIRAACDIAGDDEVYVYGSQAILGEHPSPHPDLTKSQEVDIVPKNKPEAAINIDGAIGEGSGFEELHGFYVQGVGLGTAVLPKRWKTRCIRIQSDITRGNTGICPEGHDLAISKLVAFREKDKDFVRVLLRERLVEPSILLDRLSEEVEIKEEYGGEEKRRIIESGSPPPLRISIFLPSATTLDHNRRRRKRAASTTQP